ncbi:MAG: TonB-dependent receptor plug domain-containing protein [Vicinamibacterales bacterium]
MPGVEIRSFGPGSDRRIIRGFDGHRVMVLQDGIRAGDLSSRDERSHEDDRLPYEPGCECAKARSRQQGSAVASGTP